MTPQVTSQKQKRQSGFQIVDTTSKQSTIRVPIWIYEVNPADIFPVKFEYKQKGYKGLRFSERMQRIEITN